MKIKANCLLAGLAIVMAIASWLYPATVKAIPLSYHDEYANPNYYVDTSGTVPVYWVQLYFPSSTTRGTYTPPAPGGVFEYDNYVNQVTSFTIALYGHGDTSQATIDFYLDFDSIHTAYSPLIASYLVPNSNSFTLTLDILNDALLYNGTYEKALSGGVTPSSFVGVSNDTFWVGYACHFYYDKTAVDVSVNGSNVPEPTTMLLLGSGLLGLWGARKKFKK